MLHNFSVEIKIKTEYKTKRQFLNSRIKVLFVIFYLKKWTFKLLLIDAYSEN